MSAVIENDKIRIEANLLSRLDRMPLNKSVLALVGLLAWCWVMEAFDIGMISQVILVLRELWTLSPSTVGLLGACSTAGIVIGTALAGFLTDKYGRKKILLFGVFIFTFFTLIGSLFENITWVITMRFISGLGAGAVFPLPYLMISEISPAKHRAVLVCICNAILSSSYFLPTLVGSWAITNYAPEVAWRIPFIVGGLPVVTIYFLHKYLPESPRWLMKKNRHEEVRLLVEKFERSSGVEHDNEFINPKILEALENAEYQKSIGKKANWKDIFKPPYLARSIVSWSMFSAGLITWYVLMVYVPTILTNYGFEKSHSLLLGGTMALISGFGAIAMGPLADKYGRKPIWSIYVIISIIALFALTGTESMGLLLLFGAIVAFFGAGIMPVCKLYIAEQYPTELRGVGTGFGEAVSRIVGGVLATYYLAFFLDMGGVKAVFTFMAIAFSISIIILWIWGQETAARSVDETASVKK